MGTTWRSLTGGSGTRVAQQLDEAAVVAGQVAPAAERRQAARIARIVPRMARAPEHPLARGRRRRRRARSSRSRPRVTSSLAPTISGDQDRQPGGERLGDHHAERVVARGEHQAVGTPELGGQLALVERPGDGDPLASRLASDARRRPRGPTRRRRAPGTAPPHPAKAASRRSKPLRRIVAPAKRKVNPPFAGPSPGPSGSAGAKSSRSAPRVTAWTRSAGTPASR